ncbi:MAG TPA: translocation/assembly module TamB domain-containing protein, partial [Gemmatimonadaceae bacterium]
MRKGLIIAVVAIFALLGVAALALFVVTGTDFGRERVRRFVVSALNDAVSGTVRIGSLEGNLLGGVTVHDVTIVDSTGAPFLSVERVSAEYALGDLLRKRIYLHDLTIVRPVVVLDRPPDGDWNYERIFRMDTATAPDSTLGFGDWIAFDNVRLENGHLTVRLPYEPSDSLVGAQRDSAIRDALEGGSRLMVVRTNAGLQQVMEFRDLTAELPRLRIADPDTSSMLARIATARLEALPFRPPAAEVTDVAGDFLIESDSVYWRNATARLTASRLTGFSGTYLVESGDMWLEVNGEQVALADLRWLYPPIPAEGGGSMRFQMAMRGDSAQFIVRDASITSGETEIAGDLGLSMADSIRFHDTDLRFARLDTRLIEQLAPWMEIPRRGTLGGRTSLAGTFAGLRVDADVTFDDVQLGRSHLVANGVVGFANALHAEGLRVRADPVQVALVRAVMPAFPIGGTLTGVATITGSSERWLIAEADVTHRQGNEVSRMIGRADMALGVQRFVDAELRLLPVSLATVGRFMPAAGLHGSAAGTLTARGPMRALVIAADLRLPDGGALEFAGEADVDGAEPAYDLEARLRVFNAGAVLRAAPRTSVTAVVAAQGRGIDPETMRAALALDASSSVVDSVAIDTLHVRTRVADGLLTVEPVLLSAGSSRATLEGSFGLVANRSGSLRYEIAIDSLHQLSRWIVTESDTGVVPPRPARQARILAAARADSVRRALAREVERAAMGGPPTQLEVDTLEGIPADSVSGSIRSTGTLSGSIARFVGRGSAEGDSIVLLGNAVRHVEGDFTVAKTDTGIPRIVAGASLAELEAGGFEFDSADIRGTYMGGRGSVQVAIHQERVNEYIAQAEFELNLNGSRVQYDHLALRFDTATWVSARPGRILWGPNGIEIQQVDLRNGETGRIFLDGVIPQSGPLNIAVDIRGMQIANMVTLLQTDVEAQAYLTVTGSLQGTREAPVLRGAAAATSILYNGVEMPDMRTTFNYADRRLVAEAVASRNRLPLAAAKAEIPIDLSFNATGDRMLQEPLAIELVADSLPLDALPQFTDAVSDLRGRLIGKMVVNGTVDDPRPVGAFALDLGSLRIVPSGTFVSDVNGTIRVEGDTIIIEELRGLTRGNGTISVRGGIGIADVTQPSFDLLLDAENALLLDNEQGRVYADVGLDVVGPFDGVEIIGGVNVLRGVFYIPEPETVMAISPSDPAVFAVVDTASAIRGELLKPESPLLENLVVDVAVFINRGTFARSAEANIEIHTPEDPLRIRLDQRREQIDVLGSVATDRGQYTVASRRFDITRGNALFIGGGDINPIIQLVGERRIDLVGREPLIIRVLIGGTALNPRITLESDAQPPIAQTDLLAYLAFGRSSSSLLQVGGSALSGQGTASGQLVGDVAALATR